MMDAQIREDSKIMARFMGYEYYPHTAETEKVPRTHKAGWRLKDIPLSKINSYRRYLCRSHNDLPFIHDWNLLMECWTKLLKDAIAGEDYHVSSCSQELHSVNKVEFFKSLVEWIKVRISRNNFPI